MCAYGITKVRITQLEHVRLLCGTEINSCRCSKWHDNQSPPHRHLPPLCQFVTAHSSVAVPSFNIEPERDSRKNMEERGREGENKGTDKRPKPSGASSERGQPEFIRGQRQEIYTRGILVTQVQTTCSLHPGFKSGPGPLSHVSFVCQTFPI